MLSTSLPRQYRLLLLGVTIGLAPLAWISSPWALGVLLFLGGTAIAPTLTVQNTLVGSMAPMHATTEAFTWLSTITVGASAIGAALGGALIEGPAGVSGSLALAALRCGGRRRPSRWCRAAVRLAAAVARAAGRRLTRGRSANSPAITAVPRRGVSHDLGAGRRPRAGRRLRAAGSLPPRWLRGDSDPGRLRLVRSMAPHC